MIQVTIDGQTIEVEPGTLLIEAAKKLSIDIPIFCYHPRMKPVAACRMCLVAVENMRKLQPACATPVADGMVVHTDTAEVDKAQAGVLEFLLANHPLDCPICDKGGECPLQDQSFAYGPGATRFSETKRHLDKARRLGPLVVLDQERCISCQRCTRFMDEIVGNPVLVLKERGADTVVDTADGRPFDDIFSGNTIEMCPVGALTSEPYRFKARPWDISSVDSVCPHCPVGCNMTMTLRGSQILRLLSRGDNPASTWRIGNEQIDQGWLCDRGRFGYGFLSAEGRLQTPLVREDGALREATWEEAIEKISQGLSGQVGAIGGGHLSTEALHVIGRYFKEQLHSENLDWRVSEKTTATPPGPVTTIADVDQADAFLCLETDPMSDVPVLGLRMRQNVAHGKHAKVFAAGPRVATALDHTAITYAPGEGAQMLRQAASGKGEGAVGALGEMLRGEGRLIVVWDGADPDLYAALSDLVAQRPDTGVLITGGDTNSRGAEAVGFIPGRGEGAGGLTVREMFLSSVAGRMDGLMVLASDPIRSFPDGELAKEALEKLPFLAVADFFLTPTAELADVVLPLAAFAEVDGSFMNLEGRNQPFYGASAPFGDTRGDWEIALMLSGEVGRDIDEIRQEMAEVYGDLSQPGSGAASGLEAPRTVRPQHGMVVRYPTLYYRGIVPEPYLASLVPQPLVEMGPETAASLGVRDGETAVLIGGDGVELQATVRIRGGRASGYLFLGDLPGQNRLKGDVELKVVARRDVS